MSLLSGSIIIAEHRGRNLVGVHSVSGFFQRQTLGRCADWAAIGVAIALPWSTTFTAGFIALWFVTLIGSWNIAERCREPAIEVAGVLPVALWTPGAIGMLWASVPLAERFARLNSFHKLLDIPLFAIQFRESRAIWVLIGFLGSCTLLLVVSWG